MNNSKILRIIMKEYNLTRLQIAKILLVSLPTVVSWLSQVKSKKHREMPDRMIEFLKLSRSKYEHR